MSNFKAGPLDRYRNRASCTVEELQSHFDDEKSIEMSKMIWDTLAKDPLFKTTEDERSGEMLLDDYRRLSHLRAKKICQYQFVTVEKLLECPLSGSAFQNAVGMYNWDCITRYLIHLTVSISYLEVSRLKSSYLNWGLLYFASLFEMQELNSFIHVLFMLNCFLSFSCLFTLSDHQPQTQTWLIWQTKLTEWR